MSKTDELRKRALRVKSPFVEGYHDQTPDAIAAINTGRVLIIMSIVFILLGFFTGSVFGQNDATPVQREMMWELDFSQERKLTNEAFELVNADITWTLKRIWTSVDPFIRMSDLLEYQTYCYNDSFQVTEHVANTEYCITWFGGLGEERCSMEGHYNRKVWRHKNADSLSEFIEWFKKKYE